MNDAPPIHEYVVAPGAPQPLGHYSPAVVTPDGTIWVSAQLPIGGSVTPDSAVREQAHQVLTNVVAIVEAAGGSAASVAKVTSYLTDIGDWADVDAVFAEVLGVHRPAGAVLQVVGLHHGFRVGAEAVGWRVRS